MNFIISLTNFIRSIDFTLLFAILIFLVLFKLFRNTISMAIRGVLVWIILNFVLTALFKIKLPTIPELFTMLINLPILPI